MPVAADSSSSEVPAKPSFQNTSIACVSATSGSNVSGFAGQNTGSIDRAYSNNAVNASGASQVGAFAGLNTGAISHSFYDATNAAGVSDTSATGLTGSNMFTSSNYSGFDFTNTWIMAGYPHLRAENTSNITNAIQLALISANLSGNYKLMNDIDLSATHNWNNGAGEVPEKQQDDDGYREDNFD